MPSPVAANPAWITPVVEKGRPKRAPDVACSSPLIEVASVSIRALWLAGDRSALSPPSNSRRAAGSGPREPPRTGSYTRGPVRPGIGLAEQFYTARTRASLFRELGVAHSLRRWRTDRQLGKVVPGRHEAFTRTMWEQAAGAVGASFSEPSPRLFEFVREGLAVHVLGQRTPFADPVSIELAEAKDLAYALLRQRPRARPGAHRRRPTRSPAARSFLETGPAPIVVKPARGGGAGRGVTPSIENASQLERALRRAGVQV